VNLWTAYGSPGDCIAKMREYAAAGVQTLIIRFLSYNQGAQLRRCIDDVVPRL